MTSVNVHEAKTNLSKLLQRVAAGEEIIISNHVAAQRTPCGQKWHAHRSRL